MLQNAQERLRIRSDVKSKFDSDFIKLLKCNNCSAVDNDIKRMVETDFIHEHNADKYINIINNFGQKKINKETVKQNVKSKLDSLLSGNYIGYPIINKYSRL